MPPRWEEDDIQVLRHAAKLQSATKQAIGRIQTQAADAKQVGCSTLEELQMQREHLDRIMVEGDRLEVSLQTTEKLLNKFNRVSLRFNNAGAAQRLVNKETKFRKSMEERAKERAAEMGRQVEHESNSQPTNSPVITKHSQRRRQKQESATGVSIKNDHKGLLFGISAVEPVEELKQLEQGDADIEIALDGLGLEIEELVRMSNEMANTVQSQDKCLQHVNDQLERANTKQQVNNHRSRWFLSGKKRESYERQDFFNRHSLVRKMVLQ